MSTSYEPHSMSRGRQLHLLLVALILWDVVAIAAELSFGSSLFKIDNDQIGGVLAARGSFGGAALVTLMIYVYALVRGPARHANVFWVAALEQACVALFGVYHVATKDIAFEGFIVPLIVSGALLVGVIMNLPRDRVAT